MHEEKPGAHTPWPEINQLLAVDERLAINQGTGCLLVPKSVGRLSALLFLLREKKIPYQVRGRGTTQAQVASTVLSMRAINRVRLVQDVVAVEAGCDLHTLQSTLLENQLELNVHDWVWRPFNKSSIGSVIIRGSHSGMLLGGYLSQAMLIGVEVAKPDGGVIRWGRELAAARAGPALHQLLWGIGALEGIIVQAFFKVAPLPASRLYLSWTFKEWQLLWNCFDALQTFTTSWERLDVVLAGNPHEKGYILAQIAGTSEEMELFQAHCPCLKMAECKEMLPALRNYLMQRDLQFIPIPLSSLSLRNDKSQLLPNEYVWYHAAANHCWLVKRSQGVHACDASASDPVIWKDRLNSALK